jgi:xylan 1,4-beta-xylosidase
MTFHAYENGYQSLGRQTLLLPVEWTGDGWYRVPSGVSSDQALRKPPGEAVAQPAFSDDFTAREPARQWQFYKGAGQSGCHTGDGRLTLSGAGEKFADGAFLFVTAPDHAYDVEVDVETDGRSEAGLVLFYDPEHVSGIRVDSGGLALRRVFAGSPVVPLRVAARRATLRIVNDHQDVEAFYALPGQPWQRVGRAWEVSGIQHNTLYGFRSVRPAIYACGPGAATFRQFRYRRLS